MPFQSFLEFACPGKGLGLLERLCGFILGTGGHGKHGEGKGQN
jgi:hypothetical protein